MRKKVLYFAIIFALICAVPVPFVYAADIDGTESQCTEEKQTTGAESTDSTQKEEREKEELQLSGDTYITGLIHSIDDGFPELVEEDQIILDVAVGTEILPEMLPGKVTVSMEYLPGMGDGYAPEADFSIVWDLTELEGKALSKGTFFLTGEWGECQQNITGGAVDLETLKPVCKITVEEIKPVQLPTAAFFYKTELNQDSPYSIKVSKSGRRVMIILNQKCVYRTEFSVDIVDAATKEPVLVEKDAGYNVSVLWYNVQMLNLQGFFEDGKIYEIVLNQKNGDKVFQSNTMRLDITEADLPSQTLPPQGGGDQSNDDSIDVPRDGSGRKTQDSSGSSKNLSVANLGTLLKAGKEEVPVILKGGTVYLDKDLIENWTGNKKALVIELKQTKENGFTFRIEENKTPVVQLDRSVKLKLPFGEKDSLLGSMTQKQREKLLIAKINGQIVPTAYFDSDSNAMIVYTAHTGTLTVEKGESIAFADIKGHWSKSAVDFASARRIAAGYGDGTFRPDSKIKSSEFIAFLVRNLPEGVLSAEDISSLEKVRTEQYITRGRAAELIYGALGDRLKKAEKKTDFTDLQAISPETAKAVQAVQQGGIMQGRGKGMFAPEETMSRSEALTMLINIMKVL